MKLLRKIKLNGFGSLSTLQFDNEEALPLMVTSSEPQRSSKFNEYFVAIVGKFFFILNFVVI